MKTHSRSSSLRLLALVAGALLHGPVLLAELVAITVDGSQTFQRIEGFGTAVYPHSQAIRDTYAAGKVQGMYVEDLGFNMLRVNFGFHEIPEIEDPAEIGPEDIEPHWKAAIYTDFAKAIRALDPNIRIIGTVWTPPSWMKVNNSNANGLARGENSAISAQSYFNSKMDKEDPNRVRADRVEHFVRWCAAVAAYWKEQGIEFYALSPGNEVRFSQWYNSCVWTAEDYAAMLPKLRQALEDADLGDTIIFGPETMTKHVHASATGGYIDAIYAKPEARAALDRFATHGYEDGTTPDMAASSSFALVERLAAVNNDKPIWMTEGGTGEHGHPVVFSIEGLATGIHNALVAGHVSTFVPWQVTGPDARSQNILIGDRMNHKGAAFAHFARAIPVDALRIQAEPAFGDLLASAYQHPDTGELAIVLVNPHAKPRAVELNVENVGAVATFAAWKSNATDLFAEADPMPATGGKLRFTMEAHSALSLVSKPAVAAASEARATGELAQAASQ